MKETAIWWKRVIQIGLVLSVFAIYFVVQPKEEKVTLTFGMMAGNQWDVPDDNCYKIIDETIKEFEKEYPNVRVKYTSGILKDDYSEWISQQALKGKTPDVFMVLSEDFNTFSSVGVLKNLDEYIKNDADFDKSDYYEGSYKAGQFENGQYALPYESVPTLMFVNKTLLKKEGIAIPKNRWTWEEFYQICKKVTKDSDGDGKLDQFGVYNYSWEDAVYSNGGQLFNKQGTKSNLTDTAVEDAIVFAKQIQSLSGYQTPTSNDFDMGKIAFRPMKFSEFRTYKPYPWKINKYFDFQWDCIQLPSGPGAESKFQVDNLLMGISGKTKHGSLAWEFLKKLTYHQKTQQKLFQDSQGISPLKSVTNSQKTEEILKKDSGEGSNVQVKLLDGVMKNAADAPRFRRYATVFDYMNSEMLKIMLQEDGFDEAVLKLNENVEQKLKK